MKPIYTTLFAAGCSAIAAIPMTATGTASHTPRPGSTYIDATTGATTPAPTEQATDKTGTDRQSYKIYVDKNGVMRRSDTKEEVSYYGTNYTTPFAHAYRALGYLGKDRKEAIDRDVRHMSRLGFNGFRLHLWDAELADSAGNLLDNEHLDLLDYLIARLEKEGIDIILTAQTNFGNGYPERNTDTGAYTYDFDKCEIHENAAAQKIQANYLDQLASHRNPYTGHTYAGDNAIIAMEINNEPCHSGTKKQVTEYIDRMAKTLRKAGFDKPILYNVSHNPDVTEAYYDAGIDGTTYQWYPVGLVAGHERRGNFLPYVDAYEIPWKESIPKYDKLARVVYEFDPGDLLYSYMYPAIARTFRKEGFQWITQFAYDPTDLAGYNTEYQTHFLNLAYTPAKAISMMVAAEAARNIKRGEDFGTFPADTVFNGVRVSYRQDLSELNTPERLYYSNTTHSQPTDIHQLRHIAGHGSSPVVEYPGTGAYFIDETEQPGVWRLEVWPDVALTSDPFAKPSLQKRIGEIIWSEHPMTINLPGMEKGIDFIALDGNRAGATTSATMPVKPGVYLIKSNGTEGKIDLTKLDSEKLRRYDAPEATLTAGSVAIHTPQAIAARGKELTVKAAVLGKERPKKVTIYPSDVSFWREDNRLIDMASDDGVNYTAVLPADMTDRDEVKYSITVTEPDGTSYTWPGKHQGTPLDWDYTWNNELFATQTVAEDEPVVLMAPGMDEKMAEGALLPEGWHHWLRTEHNAPVGTDTWKFTATPDHDGEAVIRQYVGDRLAGAPYVEEKKEIVVKLSEPLPAGSSVAIVGKNGLTYAAKVEEMAQGGIATVAVDSLLPADTYIIPAPFPTFLGRKFRTEETEKPDMSDIDFIELRMPARAGEEISTAIDGIWLQ